MAANHARLVVARGCKLAILIGPVVGLAVWAVLHFQPGPPVAQHNAAKLLPSERAPLIIEDSGFETVMKVFAARIDDPRSLTSIRAAYDGAGRRGIRTLKQRLAHGGLRADLYAKDMLQLAQLNLYEGDYAEAARVLAKLRMFIEKHPGRSPRELDIVLLFQGVAALRQGETENCIHCGCVSSCIFPIQPAAVHQKREGSAAATGYFAEFLQRHPDDMAARWLLNLAYMTLGEYPRQVPAEYLLPLDPFRSPSDIGRFHNIAPMLGLDRLNCSGGAIMDDFDNDGLLDLVVTSSEKSRPMALYHNRGDGTFEERTRQAGLLDQVGGLNCVQTDYNNDGRLDIFICRGGWTGQPMRPSLLRNNGDGTFTDVTRQAGLDTPIDGQVAAWADYDNDGYLDLFVGGETSRCRLYHNRGDGTFEERALPAGVANRGFMCKGATWGDYDGDGYPDLYVSNLDGPPRLFHNNRDGTFTDVAPKLGIRRPWFGFSCWFWDYDNDGWPDLFACGYERNLAYVVQSHLGLPNKGETCHLYRNLGGHGFADVTKEVGLDLAVAPMGSNFADFDNDGFLDFYLGTGTPDYSMIVPNRMFKNLAGKRFVDITVSSGTGHLQKGHGVACGDWDRDGNVDLFEELGGAVPGDRFRNVLFQNPGHANHWLTVKLIGQRTNRPAIGARIKIVVPGPAPNAFYRHVNSGSSFGGNPLQQTIGLGRARHIDTLEIHWPTSKTTQVFHNVPVDQAIEVTEFARSYRELHWKRLPVPAAME